MSKRANATARDMIVALLVLLVPIVAITVFFTRTPDPQPTRVDWVPLAAAGEVASPYRLAIPEGLPDTWTCVRARWTAKGDPGLNGDPVPGNTWQLGFLSPEQRYLGLDQRDDAAASLVADVTQDGRRDGTSALGGASWERWISPDGRTRALVITEGGSTLVLSGDVPYAALEAFATTLRR